MGIGRRVGGNVWQACDVIHISALTVLLACPSPRIPCLALHIVIRPGVLPPLDPLARSPLASTQHRVDDREPQRARRRAGAGELVG